MIELAVSGSGAAFACALRTRDHGILRRTGLPRGDDLLPIVHELLETAGVDPTFLTCLRVDIGPGSYTGLRVALTFARFLAGFRGIPVHTVTSLELLAIAAARVHGAQLVRPVLDARRGLVHHALVAVDGGIELQEQPMATPVAEVIRRHRHELLVVESSLLASAPQHGADRVPTGGHRVKTLHGLQPLVTLAGPLSVQVEDMFDARLPQHFVDHDALEPLYLMGTYADPTP